MAEHMVSEKIRKIMHEGVRGKKVPVKQAAAIAFSMKRRGKLGEMAHKARGK